MKKINFKNKGETGATPVNADNLNLLQTNVENEFETSSTNINLLNNLFENPVGEFLLWEGNVLIDSPSSGTWEKLTTFYWLKTRLEKVYPLKTGFTRSAKLCLEFTDSKPNGEIYIRFENGEYCKEYSFTHINGNSDEKYKTIWPLDFDYDNLPSGHTDILTTVDWASGGKARIYRLYLLIYDKPN